MAARKMNEPNTLEKSPPTDLLRQAAQWHLIGLLLQCPSERWSDRLTALALEVDDPKLQAAVEAAVREATPESYHSAFGPGGPAAPREVSHRDAVIPGAFLSDLCGFYEAFAYDPPTEETPDHVSTEAGFVGYLRLKQAYAHSRGDDEQAEITDAAAKRFIEEHLTLLAHRFAKTVTTSEIEYLTLTAEALRDRVGPEPIAPVDAALPILDDDDSTWSCGLGENDDLDM